MEELVIHNKRHFERGYRERVTTLPILSISNLKLGDGINIYQDRFKKNLGYRVYQDIKDFPNINHEKQRRMVEVLQDKQPNVHLTKFPHGIIVMDKYERQRVVGELITFYHNYMTLFTMAREEYNVYLYDIKMKVLDIIEELLDNGIIYIDVRSKNFMINKDFDDVQLVDFEDFAIDYTGTATSNESLKRMISLLIDLFNKLNNSYHQDFNYNACNSFDEIKQLTKKNK